jgi:hypothetical protein
MQQRGSQLVELRRGPVIGRPADTRLAMTTARTAKPREPHRHRAKQRRHSMTPPVLDVTRLTARRAIRTQDHMIAGLDGDYRLLQTRQDLPRLNQRQPQLRDLPEAIKWPDIQYIDDPCRTIDPGFNQVQDPPNPRTPSQQPIGQSYHLRPYPPTFWTLPFPSMIRSPRFLPLSQPRNRREVSFRPQPSVQRLG